jgi:hypothetical protein
LYKNHFQMKQIALSVLLSWISFQLLAQNSIGIQVGFLGTHTSIAEYERIERHDYLLDSMTLSTNIGSVQAAINADIEMGKNFYLATGFHYSAKGLSEVVFTDSIGWPWTTPAKQHYVGLSLQLGYLIPLKDSKISLRFSSGFKADFAVGTPNGGALFSGPYYRFFMPFSRFNELDLTWLTEAGAGYRLGPGEVILRLSFQYGLSDVMEDAFVIGRTMSGGITAGYSLKLSK